MSLAEMNAEWSDALKASTREAIETLDVMPSREGRVAFKHVGGGFASIDIRDLFRGVLRVVDRRTGAETVFANADQLIQAGWAID